MYADFPDYKTPVRCPVTPKPKPKPEPPKCPEPPPKQDTGLSALLSGFQWDDLILLAVILLLVSEQRDRDPTLLIVLAILFFS